MDGKAKNVSTSQGLDLLRYCWNDIDAWRALAISLLVVIIVVNVLL
jgi:hypothetical protein